MTPNEIKIDGPRAIMFQPQQLALVLDLLANAPFKHANPVIQSIMGQLQAFNTAQEQVNETVPPQE